jgi:mono/diheme cytochrome c family protein
MALRGVAVSPDGKHAYVSHVLARYQLPTTQLDRGWMNTNALTVVDVAAKEHINTVLLDNIDRGASNPWGVAVTPDGKHVCVTHAGTHEVSVIDRAKLHERLEKAAAGEQVTEVTSSAQDVPNDLAFLVGIRKRLKLAGNGPRGLAVAGGKAWAAEYFTGTLGVVGLDPETPHKPKSVALGDEPEKTDVRLGMQYVNDAAFCFQGWQSCATCHPDMRTDGLNWDLLNDGIGNPRQTKSLLLSHSTPPVMITGVRARAEVAVRAGIRYIQFAVRPEEDAEAMDEYLKQMEPVPSPYLVDGELSEAAKRGEKLFQSAGCANCHPGPLFTDLQKYDVGTGTERDAGLKFDTPTLIEAWRTGPYLVRGQAKSIMEVLTEYNKDDQHGKTSDLNEQQLKDLAEYVLSL